MELKVWVEGIQRIVCGVTENTTCQDVVYALAHATGKTGRFTLIERWRNNERLLAPQDHPLRILTKWGEYSNDVQLILQRSAIEPPPLVTSPQHIQPNVSPVHGSALKPTPKSPPPAPTIVGPPRTTKGGVLESPSSAYPLHGFTPTATPNSTNSNNNAEALTGIVTPERNKDIRKSLTFSGGHHGSSRGGRPPLEVRQDQQMTLPRSDEDSSSPHAPVNTSYSSDGTASPFSYRGGPTGGSKREAPPYREPPRPLSPPPPSQQPPVQHQPQQQQPPPYRDPPPPALHSPAKRNNTPPLAASTINAQKPASLSSSSPSHESPTPPPSTTSGNASNKSIPKPKRNLLKEFQQTQPLDNEPPRETVLYNAQYRDLIRLVNFQREKLASQQAELNKFDAEIAFWEGKTREHQHQMDFLAQEAARIEMASRQSEEQLRVLAKVEEESEIVRQQEKTLKSELTLLRSKLANCETELLQCKNKIRLLLEELQMEQRLMTRESEDRQTLERSILSEVERIQRDVEQSKVAFEMAVQRGENFKRELSTLENTITEKKQQVERLVSEMKEANLESLAIAPPEEIKHLLEGPHKPGSTRKMIGSPRQLENAVPTSKNPHGVWV